MDSQENGLAVAVAHELNSLLEKIRTAALTLAAERIGDAVSQPALETLQSTTERAQEVLRLLQKMLGGTSPAVAGPRPTPTPVLAAPPSSGCKAEIFNPEGPRELLLIVDDEAFVTLLAQTVLAEDGYRVLIANDGFEALKIYQELKDEIALVVLDFTMPVMDGSEVFDEMRRLNPEAVVMISSGFTEQERLKLMLAKGLKGFLPKPYTKQKLVFQIRSTLDALKR